MNTFHLGPPSSSVDTAVVVDQTPNTTTFIASDDKRRGVLPAQDMAEASQVAERRHRGAYVPRIPQPSMCGPATKKESEPRKLPLGQDSSCSHGDARPRDLIGGSILVSLLKLRRSNKASYIPYGPEIPPSEDGDDGHTLCLYKPARSWRHQTS